jgi:hypothetical protein
MDKFIGFDSGEFRELTGEIEQAFCDVQDVWDKYRPSLADKRYLSGDEVMEYLHISPRTLQTLRDKRIIGYTTIGARYFTRKMNWNRSCTKTTGPRTYPSKEN